MQHVEFGSWTSATYVSLPFRPSKNGRDPENHSLLRYNLALNTKSKLSFFRRISFREAPMSIIISPEFDDTSGLPHHSTPYSPSRLFWGPRSSDGDLSISLHP